MPATEKVKESMAKSEAEPVVDAASEEPRTFTCFPKLAVELRVKIWGHASSVTRNVDIWAKSLDIQLGDSHERLLYFYSSLSPPPVLHVNSEFRSKSLKYYGLCVGTNLTVRNMHNVSFTISSRSRVYFNWNTDRLCLVNLSELEKKSIHRDVSSELADFHRECQKNGLRYFAINVAFSSLSSGFPYFTRLEDSKFLKLITRKSNLEEVVLFESFALAGSDSPKTDRLELEHLDSKEQGKRLKNAKRALEKAFKKDLEETGEISGGGTPLIRISKVNVRT
jgi:hypothetical protein